MKKYKSVSVLEREVAKLEAARNDYRELAAKDDTYYNAFRNTLKTLSYAKARLRYAKEVAARHKS